MVNSKIKEFFYLIYFSARSLFIDDLIETLEELKKPKTWSSILYLVLFVGAYLRNWVLVKIAFPLIILVYVVRQRVDGKYKTELYDKSFLNDDSKFIERAYEKYKRDCLYKNIAPLELEKWKEKEIIAISKRNSLEDTPA